LIYLSTDELNQALVRAWADRRGVPVEFPTRIDAAVACRSSAILIDTDHLQSGWLEAIREHPGVPGGSRTVAAHGSGPCGDELRGRGLTVHPRLCSRVLSRFAAAAMASETTAARDASDALTWDDLI
jgi:hypothetical protein